MRLPEYKATSDFTICVRKKLDNWVRSTFVLTFISHQPTLVSQAKVPETNTISLSSPIFSHSREVHMQTHTLKPFLNPTSCWNWIRLKSVSFIDYAGLIYMCETIEFLY